MKEQPEDPMDYGKMKDCPLCGRYHREKLICSGNKRILHALAEKLGWNAKEGKFNQT